MSGPLGSGLPGGGWPPAVPVADLAGLVTRLAASESLLVMGPPGCGKSEVVRSAAAEAGLDTSCLHGTQIAPEDIGGLPSVRGERVVFHPPRSILRDGRPYCLLLEDLPECSAEVQKAFYSLLLERRIGEHPLPPGTWVVASGREGPQAAAIPPALVNRVLLVRVRPEATGWLAWASASQLHPWVMEYVRCFPLSLSRQDPGGPLPHSTPRSWSLLSRDLEMLAGQGPPSEGDLRSAAFGRLSPEDAGLFANWASRRGGIHGGEHYLSNPGDIPAGGIMGWLAIHSIRSAVLSGRIHPPADAAGRAALSSQVNALFGGLPPEYRASLLSGLVARWHGLGLEDAMWAEFAAITGTPAWKWGMG